MKRIAIVMILMLLAVPAYAGLKEKRAVKDYQEKSYPEMKKQIDAAAGFEVAVEVDWDSIAVEKKAHLYNEGFTKVYFTPLIEALKGICADEMGKTALKGALKKVLIQNKADTASPSKFTFKDGVLVIDHRSDSNFGDIKRRTEKITKLLEEAL